MTGPGPDHPPGTPRPARRRGSRRSASWVAVLALAAAACSGGADGPVADGPATTPPPEAVPTVAPPVATRGGTAPTTAPAPGETTVGPPPTTDATGSASGDPTGSVRLETVARMDAPIALAVHPPSGAVWVAERAGRVRTLDGTVLMDISAETTTDGERGLLGLAFSADGTVLYLSYTDTRGRSVLEEVAVSGPSGVVPGTRRAVLVVDQPFSNHNGGHVVVGPDGFVWWGLGDGGGAGDPHGNGQDPTTLLGSILRIDPRGGDPYAVPADNPFVGRPPARPEIAVWGLRNPWRFSFDRATGDLWVADVGQSAVEEVTRLPPEGILGANLGWNRLEGTRRFAGDPPPGHVPPTFEYTHEEGGCAVVGGHVYRGAAIGALAGWYVFGDLCDPRIRAARVSGDGTVRVVDVARLDRLFSFGEDAEGELWALSGGGEVTRLVPS